LAGGELRKKGALLKNLVMGCAVAALMVLSARSEARPPELKVLKSNSAVAPRGQFGVASWYGPEFQGLPTASGRPFNKEDMTCAHRNLPLGTRVRVTNLLNGRKLELVVTDRGPYVGKRVLDVSMAAAKRLGFMGQGVTPVRIQVLSYPHQHQSLLSQANPQAFTSVTN
jgi:peptidoglycan lytic transglycosylase